MVNLKRILQGRQKLDEGLCYIVFKDPSNEIRILYCDGNCIHYSIGLYLCDGQADGEVLYKIGEFYFGIPQPSDLIDKEYYLSKEDVSKEDFLSHFVMKPHPTRDWLLFNLPTMKETLLGLLND